MNIGRCSVFPPADREQKSQPPPSRSRCVAQFVKAVGKSGLAVFGFGCTNGFLVAVLCHGVYVVGSQRVVVLSVTCKLVIVYSLWEQIGSL